MGINKKYILEEVGNKVKKVYLAINNIRLMLKNKSIMMLIIFTSITLSVLGILFYSGYFLYDYYQSQTENQVEIYLQKSTQSSDIIRVIEELSLKEKDISDMCVSNGKLSEGKLIGEYNKTWKEHMLVGQCYSINDNRPYLLMAEYQVDNIEGYEKPVGKNIKVGGKKIRIGGIIPYSQYDNYILPVYYYINNYPTDYIMIKYNNRKNSSKIEKTLAQNTIVKKYNMKRSTPFLSEDFMGAFVQILLIFAAVIINVLCMTYAWLSTFNRKFKIYAICGATKKDIIHIALTQTVILMFSGVLVGNILFAILKMIIRKYEIVYQQNYLPYIIISGVVIILLVGFSYILAKKATKSEIIYNIVE